MAAALCWCPSSDGVAIDELVDGMSLVAEDSDPVEWSHHVKDLPHLFVHFALQRLDLEGVGAEFFQT